MTRILYPVRLGKADLNILDPTIRYALEHELKLHILLIINPGTYNQLTQPDRDAARQRFHRLGKGALQGIQDLARLEGADADGEISYGDALDVISRATKDVDVSYVVLGKPVNASGLRGTEQDETRRIIRRIEGEPYADLILFDESGPGSRISESG